MSYTVLLRRHLPRHHAGVRWSCSCWRVQRERALVRPRCTPSSRVELGLEDEAEEAATGDTAAVRVDEAHLPAASCWPSIVLWFFGYNAVTSKYSVYASEHPGTRIITLTLTIAHRRRLSVSYLPVGVVASRVGRKKTILAGVVMLTAAFTTGQLSCGPSSPTHDNEHTSSPLAGIGMGDHQRQLLSPWWWRCARGGERGQVHRLLLHRLHGGAGSDAHALRLC